MTADLNRFVDLVEDLQDRVNRKRKACLVRPRLMAELAARLGPAELAAALAETERAAGLIDSAAVATRTAELAAALFWTPVNATPREAGL